MKKKTVKLNFMWRVFWTNLKFLALCDILYMMMDFMVKFYVKIKHVSSSSRIIPTRPREQLWITQWPGSSTKIFSLFLNLSAKEQSLQRISLFWKKIQEILAWMHPKFKNWLTSWLICTIIGQVNAWLTKILKFIWMFFMNETKDSVHKAFRLESSGYLEKRLPDLIF